MLNLGVREQGKVGRDWGPITPFFKILPDSKSLNQCPKSEGSTNPNPPTLSPNASLEARLEIDFHGGQK